MQNCIFDSMIETGFAIIGAGNLGTRLSIALQQSGKIPCLVINRSPEKGLGLASKLNCRFSTELKIPGSCDYVFICTPDDTIPVIVNQLQGIKQTVLHCSGSTGMNIFNSKIKNHGVFYPLQTFTSDAIIDFKKVPVLLEGSDPSVLENLKLMAGLVTDNVMVADSDKRLKAHIAAVFAANFSNHFVYIAENILKDSGLEFNILYPLLKEMLVKIEKYGAYYSQTGPARRNDRTILDKHLKELEYDPSLQKLYTFVSDRISETYNGKPKK